MKKIYIFLLVILGLYVLLLIPFPSNEKNIQKATHNPFIWNQDSLWEGLEIRFQEAKRIPSIELDSIVNDLSYNADALLNTLENTISKPDDSLYSLIETNFFNITPLIAAQPKKSDWYINYYNRVRKKIKSDSRFWNMNHINARNTSYRLLYGMRASVEEVLLQSNNNDFISTMYVTEEPSVTPSVNILGIKVHSGDLLISRGGAEVSAFISRGNDYPGNFSHVAIIHIDKATNKPYFVEAHIEKGVAISSLKTYLNDKKLRFIVMRPRNDLPQIESNPMLPYQVSSYIFKESQTRHIPYDFKMDYYDSSAMFCSEVGSYAYKQFGISLWEFKSTISSDGVMDWLNTFGVENFVTQMPSDLEYDPMLSVVAEWRDKDILFQDHLDNAVMDALLSEANNGAKLDYNIFMLPLARVIKGYSYIFNIMGKEGVIPEGMDAISALKNNNFVEKFQNCKTQTKVKIETFKKLNGYLPPYWQLVKMAENTLSN
ncbi:YiiX/YebB-like N1pC/P60 family cysteine hydrolase [Yeosuana marina]|uniref:YiiX/YebB-like N1pC/P60 family cysteine hydrolase n=1 Tax=Yeosuana marina TaxID=1565536 RepID=UPI001423780D|nr:YiiX/YebB-like N1pC/P60 family cysteine hydrolase [Yeosuana marina]